MTANTMDSPQEIEVVVGYTRYGVDYVTPSVELAWKRKTEGQPWYIDL